MVKKAINLTAVILIGLYSTGSLASYDSVQTEPLEETNKTPHHVERVEVLGVKPLRFYRYQHLLTQKAYIKEFNALVGDNEYEIHCYKGRSGQATRILERVCAPRYEENLKGDFFFSGTGVLNPKRDVRYVKRVRAKYQEHLKITAKLLEKHPELKEAFLRMDAARVAFENKKKQKYAKN
jgi:hypothetical protein